MMKDPLEICAATLRRPLAVCADAATAAELCIRLREVGAPQPTVVETAADAFRACSAHMPTLILVDADSASLNGPRFVFDLRRAKGEYRAVPVILFAKAPTVALTLRARDSGVHEVMRRPFTRNELVRRLMVISEQPRHWIEAERYVGPDRRSFNAGFMPPGADRRRSGGAWAAGRIAKS